MIRGMIFDRQAFQKRAAAVLKDDLSRNGRITPDGIAMLGAEAEFYSERALAAGSRRAKTAKPVECEASQSGGCKPQRPTSTTPISIPQEPEHG